MWSWESCQGLWPATCKLYTHDDAVVWMSSIKKAKDADPPTPTWKVLNQRSRIQSHSEGLRIENTKVEREHIPKSSIQAKS